MQSKSEANEVEIKISYFKHPIYKDYGADENGNIYSLKFGKIKLIKQNENKGYFKFHIYYNGKDKFYLVHRFVFECLNNRLIEKNKDIDHIDHDRKNNNISNLREVSKLTNNLNRFSNMEIKELPEDAVAVEKYNSHLFENLYFSPSNNCLYKSSEDYKFRIEFKSYKLEKNNKNYFNYQTSIYDINEKSVHICLNKLRKALGC